MIAPLSIRKVWERKGLGGKILWFALMPLSKLYGAVAQTRNFCYSHGIFPSVRLARPVVSVGNLTVGGTGKTPTCLWLARELNMRGLKVGILSRGYRRKEKSPVVLQPDNRARETAAYDDEFDKAGDEPMMMVEIYRQVVGVGADRAAAAAALLQCQDVDVFLLDDGFQHRRLQRDVDILLLGQDSDGCMLPAGPFREPRRNFRRAHFLLATAANGDWASFIAKEPAHESFKGSLRPVCLVGFDHQAMREFPLTLLYRSKILAVTGIADARGLYRLIHDWDGEIVETLEFPDHYSYTSKDWQQISRLGRLADLIITTEKDILKLRRFPFAKDKLLALRVTMEVAQGDALVAAVVAKIETARRPMG